MKGSSQTESYLKALAPTRQAAYAKIKEVLTAPPVDKEGTPDFNVPKVQINPQAFEPFINQAIETEKKHAGYYAFYHGSDKEGILIHLLRTYINQVEHDWTRNDFFMLRTTESFYKRSAKSALDYMKQNSPYILQQFIPQQGSKDPNCVLGSKKIGDREECKQLDFTSDWKSPSGTMYNWRSELLSTSPAFVAGVDDAGQSIRNMSEQDWAAWESSFYYFAAGLSWTSIYGLFPRLVGELKKHSPFLFENTPMAISLRKYIGAQFAHVAEILFPHNEQKKFMKIGSTYDLHSKAGMMFQFLIPANIVDDVVYLAWTNGVLWQRMVNGFQGGWDNSMGAYVKVSPMLDRLKASPQLLSRAINLFQTRIIYKDERYLNDPKSPIKINLIHSLPPALFKSIEDSLKAIARVVVENKQTKQQGAQKIWFEQTDIANAVKAEESSLATLFASKNVADQKKALSTLYYFVAMGVDIERGKQMATKYKDNTDPELMLLSKSISKSITEQLSK